MASVPMVPEAESQTKPTPPEGKVECPECGGFFSPYGIGPHRRLGHGVANGKPKKRKAKLRVHLTTKPAKKRHYKTRTKKRKYIRRQPVVNEKVNNGQEQKVESNVVFDRHVAFLFGYVYATIDTYAKSYGVPAEPLTKGVAEILLGTSSREVLGFAGSMPGMSGNGTA